MIPALGEPESDHEFTEVALVRQNHPVLVQRDRPDRIVVQVPRIVPANAGRVETSVLEIPGEPGIGTDVDQEAHTQAAVGFGLAG
jgi:hypothetical protein